MNPDLSIIIPVYRERLRIRRTLEHLGRLPSRQRCEIIVCDGDPLGTTIQRISDPDIISRICPKGRGLQMNAGAGLARAPALLFLHADTLLPSRAVDSIIETCHGHRFTGGAFDLGIDARQPVYRLIETMVRMRTRITRIPYGDQAIFIKKRAFDDIGGFAHIPIMEDIDLMRRIKKAGHRIRILPDKVLTDARRWEAEGPIFCTIRNNMLALLYFAGVPATRLKRWYP